MGAEEAAPLMLKPVALVGDEVRTGGGGVILDGLNDDGAAAPPGVCSGAAPAEAEALRRAL